MIELTGQPGELRMTIEIKRAATGKVDTYELVGSATDEQAEKLGLKEPNPKEPQKDAGGV